MLGLGLCLEPELESESKYRIFKVRVKGEVAHGKRLSQKIQQLSNNKFLYQHVEN